MENGNYVLERIISLAVGTMTKPNTNKIRQNYNNIYYYKL